LELESQESVPESDEGYPVQGPVSLDLAELSVCSFSSVTSKFAATVSRDNSVVIEVEVSDSTEVMWPHALNSPPFDKQLFGDGEKAGDTLPDVFPCSLERETEGEYVVQIQEIAKDSPTDSSGSDEGLVMKTEGKDEIKTSNNTTSEPAATTNISVDIDVESPPEVITKLRSAIVLTPCFIIGSNGDFSSSSSNNDDLALPSLPEQPKPQPVDIPKFALQDIKKEMVAMDTPTVANTAINPDFLFPTDSDDEGNDADTELTPSSSSSPSPMLATPMRETGTTNEKPTVNEKLVAADPSSSSSISSRGEDTPSTGSSDSIDFEIDSSSDIRLAMKLDRGKARAGEVINTPESGN